METTTTLPPPLVTDGQIYARLAYELRRLSLMATGHSHSITCEAWSDNGAPRAELQWRGSVHTLANGDGCRVASGKSLEAIFDALEDADDDLTDRIAELRSRSAALLREALELEAQASDTKQEKFKL